MTLQPEASVFLEESDGAIEIPNSLRSVESSEDSLDIEDEKTEEFQDAEAILFNLPERKTQPEPYAALNKQSVLPIYDDPKECIKILKSGIVATKFNFSNTNFRDIKIRLSQNEKELLYKDATMWREKSMTVTELRGILYGGSS